MNKGIDANVLGRRGVTPRRVRSGARFCAPLLLAAVGVGAAACSSDEEITGATTEEVTPGIEYSAESSELVVAGSTRLLVVLTIENTTSAPIVLSYPAGCPLKIRLYRTLDNQLVYDEAKVACALSEPATVSIEPLGNQQFGSGFRVMTAIAGDSLPLTSYRVVAVPGTEGDKIVEVEAGTTTLKQ